MKLVYTYLCFEEHKEGSFTVWHVKNRMFKKTIGILRKSIGTCAVFPEWCYWPERVYSHQQIEISTTNMSDILKFIKQLKQ